MRTLRVFETVEDLSQAAGEAFAAAAAHAVSARGRFVVGLTGGDTPGPIYSRLASPPFPAGIAWPAIDWFWSDERAVGPDDPSSNYGLAERTLLSRVAVDRTHVHRMPGDAADLDAAAAQYAAQIATCLGAGADGPPPAFDLVHLGLGPDGHTASLFPGTRALHERRRWVAANDVGEPRTRRLTFTFPLINAARAIHVFVTGERKADALRAVLEGPVDPDRYPAQRVSPIAGDAIWFVDRAAASRLTRP